MQDSSTLLDIQKETPIADSVHFKNQTRRLSFCLNLLFLSFFSLFSVLFPLIWEFFFNTLWASKGWIIGVAKMIRGSNTPIIGWDINDCIYWTIGNYFFFSWFCCLTVSGNLTHDSSPHILLFFFFLRFLLRIVLNLFALNIFNWPLVCGKKLICMEWKCFIFVSICNALLAFMEAELFLIFSLLNKPFSEGVAERKKTKNLDVLEMSLVPINYTNS